MALPMEFPACIGGTLPIAQSLDHFVIEEHVAWFYEQLLTKKSAQRPILDGLAY